VATASEQDRLFRCLLSTYHYLGLRNTVGENMKYLVHGNDGRLLACLLFGAAAWKCRARDAWIGWDAAARERNLALVANNTRFLVCLGWTWRTWPVICSPASRGASKRLAAKYGHSLHCLETFVDTSRYRGVCYQAANWQLVGHSTGRSRNDRQHRLRVPSKAIFLYPLRRRFPPHLCDDA
jgi:hypothetical protein